eukprot:CFRG6280T1
MQKSQGTDYRLRELMLKREQRKENAPSRKAINKENKVLLSPRVHTSASISKKLTHTNSSYTTIPEKRTYGVSLTLSKNENLELLAGETTNSSYSNTQTNTAPSMPAPQTIATNTYTNTQPSSTNTTRIYSDASVHTQFSQCCTPVVRVQQNIPFAHAHGRSRIAGTLSSTLRNATAVSYFIQYLETQKHAVVFLQFWLNAQSYHSAMKELGWKTAKSSRNGSIPSLPDMTTLLSSTYLRAHQRTQTESQSRNSVPEPTDAETRQSTSNKGIESFASGPHRPSDVCATQGDAMSIYNTYFSLQSPRSTKFLQGLVYLSGFADEYNRTTANTYPQTSTRTSTHMDTCLCTSISAHHHTLPHKCAHAHSTIVNNHECNNDNVVEGAEVGNINVNTQQKPLNETSEDAKNDEWVKVDACTLSPRDAKASVTGERMNCTLDQNVSMHRGPDIDWDRNGRKIVNMRASVKLDQDLNERSNVNERVYISENECVNTRFDITNQKDFDGDLRVSADVGAGRRRSCSTSASNTLRKEVEDNISQPDGPDENCFIHAQNLCFETLNRVYFVRYQQSAFYSSYLLEELSGTSYTLLDLLNNDHLLTYFSTHMSTAKAVPFEGTAPQDLLAFWLSARNFKDLLYQQTMYLSQLQQLNDVKIAVHQFNIDAQETAMSLYERFISWQAYRPVHVPAEIRRDVEANISDEGGPTNSCFEKAQRYAFEVMEENYFDEFRDGVVYRQLCSQMAAEADKLQYECNMMRAVQPPGQSGWEVVEPSTDVDSIFMEGELLRDRRKLRDKIKDLLPKMFRSGVSYVKEMDWNLNDSAGAIAAAQAGPLARVSSENVSSHQWKMAAFHHNIPGTLMHIPSTSQARLAMGVVDELGTFNRLSMSGVSPEECEYILETYNENDSESGINLAAGMKRLVLGSSSNEAERIEKEYALRFAQDMMRDVLNQAREGASNFFP